MHPRLYLHSLQSVTVDQQRGEIFFTTRHANGCFYYFPLSRNQFLSLNDIIILIDSHKHTSGHFPLGEHLWLHLSEEVTLYYTTNGGRPYFKFQSFTQYRKYAHERILSLLRLSDAAVGRRGGRKRNRSRPLSSNHQRTLPSIVQAATRSPAAKRTRGGRESLPRSTNDALVSHSEEESVVLSQRDNTNSRWRIDSSSSSESEAGDSEYHENEQDANSCLLVAMEGE